MSCHSTAALRRGVLGWVGAASGKIAAPPAGRPRPPANTPSAPATCPPELNRMPIPTWTLTLPRQALLKEAMGRLHQVKANFTSIRLSAMEDFIGRGDRSIGPVLRRAWELVRGRGGGPQRRPAVAAADLCRACSDSSAVEGRGGGPAGLKCSYQSQTAARRAVRPASAPSCAGRNQRRLVAERGAELRALQRRHG